MNNREQLNLLEEQTLINYNAAIKYYAQKKAQFLQLMINKEQKEEEKFLKNSATLLQKLIQEKIVDTWEKVYQTILSAVQIGDFKQGSIYTVDESKLINIPDWLKKNIIDGQQNKNFYSFMGLNYEQYAATLMKDIGQEIISKGYKDCMSAFIHTGSMKSISQMRSGFLDIRADLGQGFEQFGNIVKDKNSNLSAELQTEFIIENNINKEGLINDNELIKQYIQSGMFGVSMKLWALGSSNKEFTQASGIASRLNQIYDTKKTWNITYAVQMANKVISNYLLDVVGPVNIGLLTGTGFIWMDEFIGNSLFFMNIQPKNNRYYKNKDILNEIKPKVNDNKIFVRNYNISTAIANKRAIVSSTKIINNANGKPYKISMRLKRIK